MADFVPSQADGTLAAKLADGTLAAKLADARRRMAALDLPRPLAARLHRQFIAICDAIKAPGADEASGERRLAAFLAALEQAAARISGPS